MAAQAPAEESVVILRGPDAPVSALGIARATAQAIERGVYQPGARLREQELADKFGCSRAPVREAMRILESQGMVVIEAMKGARVASTTDATFREVFLIRRALAGLMAEAGAAAPMSDQKQAFIAAALQPAAIVETASTEAFVHSVRGAIRLMGQVANMPKASQMSRSLTFGHQAFQEDTLSTLVMRRRNARLWAKVGRAFRDGNGAKARAAIEGIFDIAFDYVERVMNKDLLGSKARKRPAPERA
ncbi:MAG TPA: hypothetical protein DCL54_14845 [Alphaproteobacteria bacterium]|nr:hypothetical protein [Alphaproteobacteria bacterium]HAJ47849.1 hypothetical protein [Alphaproteobacteria bacterium]